MRPIRITAHCKIITPMLSSGADPQKFEIRATAVKSSLRFWWRAFQPLNGHELFSKEKKLFGSTEAACPFRLWIKVNKQSMNYWQPGELVNQPNDPFAWGAGVQYVFFSVFDPPRKDKYKNGRLIRPANQPRIKPGSDGREVAKPDGRFTIHITFNSNQTSDDVGDILCALWLVENFSGLGGRTRRGAGCFEIENDLCEQIVTENSNFPKEILKNTPSFHPKPDETIEQFISSGLKQILRRWNTSSRGASPLHSAYHSADTTPQVILLKSHKRKHSSAFKVMNTIGVQMKNFCNTFPFDEAKQMHKTLANNATLPGNFNLSKASKGLPIIYNFSRDFGNVYSGPLGLNYKATSIVCDENGQPVPDAKNLWKEGGGRRSSPLFISCHKKNGTSYAAICHFPTSLLPRNEKIGLIAQKKIGKSTKVLQKQSKLLKVPKHTFVKNLLFNTVQYNANGRNLKKYPLIQAFDQCFMILPEFKKIKGGHSEPELSYEKSAKTDRPTKQNQKPKPVLTPLEILKSPNMADKILVQLTQAPSAQNKYKIWSATRLSLDENAIVIEEKGWTVTAKAVKAIMQAKVGSFLKGQRNPQNPKRLDRPELAN